MYLWGLRVTTYLTNSLVLVGYALLFEWVRTTNRKPFCESRWRQTWLLGATVVFILLFHFASVFSIWEEHHAVGYGWSYITFQVGTVLYALLSSRRRSLLVGLAALILAWYWWLPNVPHWPLWYLVSLALMVVAQRFGHQIGSRPWVYYPFCLVFAASFMYVNFLSVRGIDVGWPWLIVTYLSVCLWLAAVHYATKHQREVQARLRAEAQIDELTGLFNFRVFNEDLLTVYQRVQKSQRYFALYTFDVDHFKAVNDHYGHLVGNQVLEQVAQRLCQIAADLPYDDVRCYRTGGEEFSFILPDVQPDCTVAKDIAWRVHDELGQLRFTAEDGAVFNISISLGEDRSDPTDQNYLDVYNRADQYLYQSKNRGRNTITINGATQPQRA